MSEIHRLHEASVERRAGAAPAGPFTVRSLPAPDGIALIELAGGLDIAATSSLRTLVEAAAGGRGVVLDLSRATFVDSSMLKELLRASAELARYETCLVLAGAPPVVRRLLELTRTTELFTLTDDRAGALALVSR